MSALTKEYACTCWGKHSHCSRSWLRWQSPDFFSAGKHKPFSWAPTAVPGAPVLLAQPPSIWRTASWLRSTWKSAETFLPSRTSIKASDTKKGSIYRSKILSISVRTCTVTDLTPDAYFFALILTLVTGPVSLSLTHACSIRLRDLHVIMNLLPSFSSNGRTGVLSDSEFSVRGLLRTCGKRKTVRFETCISFLIQVGLINHKVQECVRSVFWCFNGNNVKSNFTGVSGSRENRFSRSSLLAERILSSVSEIYCNRMDSGETERLSE